MLVRGGQVVEQSDSLPPCIVLGLETQIALGVVRELGRAGVRVIGIAQSPHAIGLKSRFLFRGVVVEQPRSDKMLSRIRELGAEHGGACLLTVSEANLNWLLKNRAALGNVTPILPTENSLAMVLDKQKTLALAEKVGIDVPKTVEPDSLASVRQAAATLTFPVVLKWKDPNAAGPILAAKGLPMNKAEYALNADQLVEIGKRYEVVQQWPLIQEYCPGVGLGQFFYMHNGQALRRFQHRRIAEWPPEGGFSSVCDSVPLSEHTALQEKSIELLRQIGWEGVAMVEYRFDPATGRAVLMEINGRFWGSFPLAVHCRAGFALLAYQVQGAGIAPKLEALVDGLRCRMVVTELKRLVRICFGAHLIRDPFFRIRKAAEIGRFLADFLRSNVRYFLWSSDDPAPFFRDIANALMRRNR